MDLRSIIQIVTYQLSTVRDAPIPPIAAVLLAGALIWLALKWRYTARIDSLRRAIARRDAEIATLRAALPAIVVPGLDEPAPTEIARPAGTNSGKRNKALRLIVNAIDEAEIALRSGQARETDKAMAGMGLALRTANNTFDLPIPAFGADPATDIALGKRFLERVRPPLRAGDDEAAQRSARAFLSETAVRAEGMRA